MKISRLLTMVGVVFVLIVLASVVLEAAEQARGSVDLGSVAQEYDFGDAPEELGYPTLLSSNGARHVWDNETFLGEKIDFEEDGQPQADALGDDKTGLDDEDGVLFTSPLLVGARGQVDVTGPTRGSRSLPTSHWGSVRTV
jgi:hypothetical protein